MKIIRKMADIDQLEDERLFSKALLQHLRRKLTALCKAVEPETDVGEFSLDLHGPIGLLEKNDRNLTALGLPEAFSEIMPEWVSRLEVTAGELYYVLYVMSDNDFVTQVYLPDSIISEAIQIWLSEQPMEEEDGYDADITGIHPF